MFWALLPWGLIVVFLAVHGMWERYTINKALKEFWFVTYAEYFRPQTSAERIYYDGVNAWLDTFRK